MWSKFQTFLNKVHSAICLHPHGYLANQAQASLAGFLLTGVALSCFTIAGKRSSVVRIIYDHCRCQILIWRYWWIVNKVRTSSNFNYASTCQETASDIGSGNISVCGYFCRVHQDDIKDHLLTMIISGPLKRLIS